MGYNTWGNTMGIHNEFDRQFPNHTLLNQKYDVLDVKDIDGENPTGMIPIEHCIKSFLFLVTETHTEPELMFFSEKIYKPISIGMPFICLGNPGSLKMLRDQGFITFHDWINESYDIDMPLERRIDVICNEILKFNGLSDARKKEIRYDMHEYTVHNQNLLKLLVKKNNLMEKLKLIQGDHI
jgi:hypothetical protein